MEPSSDEDDAVWDPEREEDACEDGDDDEADEAAGDAEEEATEVAVPAFPQDLER